MFHLMCFQVGMDYLKWHEQNYEDLVDAVIVDPIATQNLMDVGILKFFKFPFFISIDYFIHEIIQMWDLEHSKFHVGGEDMRITS